MNSTPIIVKTKTCVVCGNYELWSLDRQAVESWQAGELIQNAFPDMSLKDREIMISGTHPDCWNKLFGEKESEEMTRCNMCMTELDSEVTICPTCKVDDYLMDYKKEGEEWEERTGLTHAQQLDRYGWCVCEGTSGEGQMAEDCPNGEGEDE